MAIESVPWGHCEFVCSGKKRRRRREGSASSNRQIFAGPLLIQDQNLNEIVVCLPLNNGDSVGLPFSGSLKWDNSVRIISSEDSSIYSAFDYQIIEKIPCSIIRECPVFQNKTTVTIAALHIGHSLPSIPISAVFRITKQPNTPTSTLAMLSLKRQMPGIYVMHDPKSSFTTQVRFACKKTEDTYIATLEKVVSQQRASQSSALFLLAPTTRITFLESTHEPTHQQKETSCTNSAVSGHGFASTLAKTIEALHTTPTLDLQRVFTLSGPPGVGKTHAVKAAIKSLAFPTLFKSVRGSEVMSRDRSETFLRNIIFRMAIRSFGKVGVLFFDECEALLSAKTILAPFAELLDLVSLKWRHIVIVCATNLTLKIPAELRRPGRFDCDIIMQPPPPEERRKLLSVFLDRDLPDLEEIANLAVGFVAADLLASVRCAIKTNKMAAKRSGEPFNESLRRAIYDVGASMLRDTGSDQIAKVTWDDIAGDPGGAKTALIQAVTWPRSKKDAFDALGLDSPRGVLLYGPPGCAKSSLAKAAAASEGTAFISLSPADVFSSSFTGQAEAVIRGAFARARAAAPCILFFDEIDAIVGSTPSGGHNMERAGAGGSPESRVLSTFLNESDGLTSIAADGVVMLAATNRPSVLDAALLRPGRFDKVIYVPPPDFDGRVLILESLVKKLVPLASQQNIRLGQLAAASVSGQMTGAEIHGACYEAASELIQEAIKSMSGVNSLPPLSESAFERSLRKVEPLLQDSRVTKEYSSLS